MTETGNTRLRPGWRRVRAGALEIRVSGYLRDASGAALDDGALVARLRELLAAPPEDIARWLDGLDGLFALVAVGPERTIAAVDPVRSIPLVWAETSDGPVVSEDAAGLAARLGLGSGDIDRAQARAFAMSGFTVGEKTLYRAVHPVPAGGFLLIANGAAGVHRYHRWQPWAAHDADPEDLKALLAALHETLIERLIASAGGREILVPLSAGLDSRFVASGLKAAGYDRVRCFAYGQPGNREAVMSRRIANRLGYDWTFLPYTQASVREAWHNEAHAAYWHFADSLSAVPFPQEFLALRQLGDKGWLADAPIMVNGQSGDFITGNHVPAALFEPRDDGDAPRRGRITDALMAKHFKLWRVLDDAPNAATSRELISAEIDRIGGLPGDPAGDHGVYEFCEFQDRQSKYVVAGQRVYEWFGLDWRLPLWERPCLDFWEKAPLAAKRRQALYRTVLTETDWAGVWRDLPVNPTRIRPAWLVPVRASLKALHLPLGRARWHAFEKRYLEYWMAPLCHYAPWGWRRVSGDARGHRSPIAWYVADYLAARGLDWDGAPKNVEATAA